MSKVNVAGIDKASLLQAAYNAAKIQGMGFLQARGDFTLSDAQRVVEDSRGNLYFDYLLGRVMKINLAGDEVDPHAYDRDNGPGAFQRVVDSLRRGAENSASDKPQSNFLAAARAMAPNEETTRWNERVNAGVLLAVMKFLRDALSSGDSEIISQIKGLLDTVQGASTMLPDASYLETFGVAKRQPDGTLEVAEEVRIAVRALIENSGEGIRLVHPLH